MASKADSLKGYLFEDLIRILVSKAGFNLDFDSNQLNKNKTKLHGRGAVHQIDVMGEFKISLPFVYPILIVGEIKAYKGNVGIAPVRNFVGVISDIREYINIDTKSGGKRRYRSVTEKQFTYCPVFFSLKGFAKTAEEYLIAHGIYPVCYRNNPFIFLLYNLFDELINQINLEEIKRQDKIFFHKISNLNMLRSDLKKAGFYYIYEEMLSIIDNLHSYFAIIDGKIMVNLLLNTKIDQIETISLRQRNELFTLLDRDQELGYFSLSSNYIKYHEIESKFSYIDVILAENDQVILKKIQIISMED